MYKYIILILSISLSVLCDLNKEEGAECDWEGVKGTCVNQKRCFTSLDARSPSQPICSMQGETKIICCTDCKLVNDTSNAVFSPSGDILWKDGGKARDNCIKYLDEQPYRCRDGGFYSGIQRSLDEEKKCHRYNIWAVGGAPYPGHVPGPEYPHQALLGYESKGTVSWKAGGSIISDRFILTAAHVNIPLSGEVSHIAMGVLSLSDPATRQERKVKRFIPHPDFKPAPVKNDIALIEVDSPIQFSVNVMPACLFTTTSEFQTAITTTWRDLKGGDKLADTIQTINLEEFNKEDVISLNVDSEKQLFYGSKIVPSESCRGFSGEPLLAQDQFARCIYSVIGVTSEGPSTCGSGNVSPNIYTKVAYYLPWIESVVWP
ncbi:chymotrypsinogen B-like [Trichoplusia ni]|uniref:Chymotrypsinogen B-like n=1 Tax=Trichoplusia ni TaxID=7111 RepID=A0A7E5WVA4_TRINI|nr:chymotrypsinogen B-like [Trichoplusia ni]